MSNDNVLDLLDSLDKPSKQKPKKSSSKRKEKKATGEDILGFLDELEKKKDTPEATPTEPTKNEPKTTEEKPVDSFVSSWWSKKNEIWSKAQETLNSATSEVDTSKFNLSMLQSKLTTVLNTIVPPISSYEQLKIYFYHNLVGYSTIDDLLYQVFDYVMDQVEGGTQPELISKMGPERLKGGERKLNFITGTVDEAYLKLKTTLKELESENKGDSENKISEVFVGIQPVVCKEKSLESEELEVLRFVVCLQDREHDIFISTQSQALPVEWAHWLDSNGHGFKEASIDPREWVSGWVEDALNLSFGVIAQKYVTVRMGLTK